MTRADQPDAHDDHARHGHDRGLSHDLPTLLSRRRALTLFGGVGLAAALAACGDGATTSTAGTATAGPAASTATTGAAAVSSTTQIPAESAGPYPSDGSNGVDVLSESGVVRQDITTSFGSSTTKAEGVPLRIDVQVLDTRSGATPYAGSAVYLWHGDAAGNYSMYSPGTEQENYLRGVQVADADGRLSFTSTYPAAYSGRWPHIHLEVYADVDAATSASSKLRTSQLSLPEQTSALVYATPGYEGRVVAAAGDDDGQQRRRLDGHPGRPRLTAGPLPRPNRSFEPSWRTVRAGWCGPAGGVRGRR